MSALLGVPLLARIALRRDRVVLPLSFALVLLTVVSTAISFDDLYPTTASRLSLAADIEANAGLRALYGQLFDGSTVGGLLAWRMVAFAAAMTALLNLLIVVRHTRGEEESGRLELIGAGAVGRGAPLSAALLVLWAADLAFALVLVLALVAAGQPLAGSLALALGVAAAGGFFAAVAALTAQLTTSARLASGLAAATLGVAFLLRAAGDAGSGTAWLTWLSPLGWSEQLRPYAGERWWPLLLLLAATAALTAGAYALRARRDLGAGLLADRPGPPRAAAGLRSPFALAWRLQRGALLGWSCGFLVAGAVLCGIADSVADLLDGNREVTDIFQRLGGSQQIVDAFLAAMISLLGMVAAAYAVQSVLRLRGEETAGRAKPLLATAVGRLRWAAGHLAFAVVGTTILLLCAGVAGGVAFGLASGDVGGQLGRVTGAALAQAPAAWIAGAVAVALVGLAPRRSALAWAVVVLFFLLGEFGPLLEAPQWLLDLSPFAHLPSLPGGEATAAPFVALTAIAAAVGAAGLAGLRRRDLG